MFVGGLDAARWAGGDSRRSGKPGGVAGGNKTWGRGRGAATRTRTQSFYKRPFCKRNSLSVGGLEAATWTTNEADGAASRVTRQGSRRGDGDVGAGGETQ